MEKKAHTIMMEDQGQTFSQIASVLGEKARAAILWNLLDGRAYTATELSICAGISPQSASNHLGKLVSAQILMIEKQGRHRYYRFASADVALAIEAMASLMPLTEDREEKKRPEPAGLMHARTCYDHLAGKIGVTITGALLEKGILAPSEKGYELGPAGKDWFSSVGIAVEQVKLQKRLFAYQCLDWSERRHHLAGGLGAALLQAMLKKDWLRKTTHSRRILITPIGKMEIKNRLGIEI